MASTQPPADLQANKKQAWIASLRHNPLNCIIAALVILNIALVMIYAGMWIMAGHQGLFLRADFTAFYTGFKMVLNGDGARLYDLSLQAAYQQAIMGNIQFAGGLLIYINPPILALLLSPLALFPVNLAFYVWSAGELGLLIWLIVLLHRLLFTWSGQERWIMTLGLLAFWPLGRTFLLGQFSLLLLLSLTQVFIAIRRSQAAKAGSWMTALLIKPQLLVIPAMMTLNKRFWKIALFAILTFIGIFLFTSLILGPVIWVDYFKAILTVGNKFGEAGIFPGAQFNVRGILTSILGNSQAALINAISLGILVIGMVIVWLLWFKQIVEINPRLNLYFSFTILLAIFFGIYTNHHDDLILFLPIVLFYDYLRQNNYPRKAYTLLVLISPLVFFVSEFYPFKFLGIFSLPILVILALLGWMIKYLILEFHSQPAQVG